MFEFELPAIPAGILVLLAFFAPYASAIPINPKWSTAMKKLVAIAVSALLAVVVIVIAVGMGWELPEWPLLIILAIAISQAAYDLVLKKSADRLAAATSKEITR